MASTINPSQVSAQEDLLIKLQRIGSNILTRIGWTDMEEGNKRIKRFKDNGFKWLGDDYEHQGFQAVYCERLFMTRAENIFYILSTLESCNHLPNLLYNTSYKARKLYVASFGCGPGSDLAGFETFHSNLKARHIKSLQASMEFDSISESEYSLQRMATEEARIDSIIGYDSAKGWSRYLEVLGYSFQHQVIDSNFVSQMAPVDVVILSYFAHNAHFSKPLDPPQQIQTEAQIPDSARNWDILMQQSKLIIVVDTSVCKMKLISLLGMRGFSTIVGGHDNAGRDFAAHVWLKKDAWT